MLKERKKLLIKTIFLDKHKLRTFIIRNATLQEMFRLKENNTSGNSDLHKGMTNAGSCKISCHYFLSKWVFQELKISYRQDKIFPIHISEKKLSRIYKELPKLNSEETDNPTEKYLKIFNR